MWYIILGLFAAVLVFYDVALKYRYLWKSGMPVNKRPYVVISWPFGLRTVREAKQKLDKNSSLEHLTEAFGLVGRKTFLLEMIGTLAVVTYDPENIKTVLATSFKDYSLGLRHPQLGAFLGDGIFTLSGEGWKHSRTMLRSQFSREQVAQLESLKHHGAELLKRLDGAAKANEFIDIQLLFHQLTMDTATEFLFGQSTDSLNDSQRLVNGVSAAQFVKDYDVSLYWSLVRIMAGPLYFLIKPKVFKDAVSRSRRFVEFFVQQALDNTSLNSEKDPSVPTTSSYYFTHELAKVTRDPVVIRDQAFNVLLAGRDTTASLMSYTIYYLAQNPAVWKKLKAAVAESLGDNIEQVTFESLKRTQYLTWVINEVLRLNPIVPRNFRTAIRDTWLPRGGGEDEQSKVFVPKGTQVIYSVYTLQRNKEYWGEDADEFRPERWGENERSRGWEYLPFNGGPRICLGQQFALTEASLTIALLTQTYSRIEIIAESQNKPSPSNFVRLTTNVAGGVHVKMHRS